MTPWEIIEQALAHRKPARSPQWLANELSKTTRTTIQTIHNWKSRGVPPARYRSIATALGISVDQLEGLEPLPWEKDFPWPFSSELQEQIGKRNSDELVGIELAVWDQLGVKAPARLVQQAESLLGVTGLTNKTAPRKSVSK